MSLTSSRTTDPRRAEYFRALLEERWSCRAYLPDRVPQEVMVEMFDTAQRTASWCNTQPWEVAVLSGAPLLRLSAALVERASSGSESPDIPGPTEYTGVYLERRRETGYALYESLGIERSDRAARARQALKNYEFFGAPHVAVITTDRAQGTYGALDCGAYVANFVNAATSLGIATIPQAAIAMQADVVRSFLDLPEERLVVCAVSFGYADLDHPVNGFRTSRASVADAVTFVE